VNHAAIDRKPLWRHAEFLRGELDENAARFGGGGAQLLTAFLDASGARGTTLIHTGVGVAHHDLDGLERHVEFFRHHLRNCNVEPLAAINLAVEGQDRAVGVHRDVGR